MNQESYCEYIKNNIPKEVKVNLYKPMIIEGKPERLITKLGFSAYKKVNVSVSDIYTRSLRIILQWDNNETNFILFCPTTKSPISVKMIFNLECRKLVNNKYTDEELEQEQIKARKDLGKKLKESLSKLKNK